MPNYNPGRFVWHELFTSDLEASKKFYAAVAGWSYETVDMGDFEYTMFKAGGTSIGGLMSLDKIPMKGVPPHFLGYVSVPNVDESAAAVKAGGGKVLQDPFDIPKVGRIAVLQDPQGGVFATFKSADGDPPEVEKPEVGTIVWDHLNTNDPAAAKAFYAKVCGWKAEENGPHTVFMRGAGKFAGGLGDVPPGTPPHWLAHIMVADLAKARELVTKHGGRVLMDEIPVPGFGKFAVVQDNVGAICAAFEAG